MVFWKELLPKKKKKKEKTCTLKQVVRVSVCMKLCTHYGTLKFKCISKAKERKKKKRTERKYAQMAYKFITFVAFYIVVCWKARSMLHACVRSSNACQFVGTFCQHKTVYKFRGCWMNEWIYTLFHDFSFMFLH